MELAILILIFLLILLATIAYATYTMVNKMAAAPSFQPVPELASLFIDGLDPATAEFLQSKGFRFHQAYQMHALRIGRWARAEQAPVRSFTVSRIMANTVSEFITEFSEDASLTTTTTRAAFMFPRGRGGFMQSFPRASIERLWEAHQKGEEFLLSSRSLPVSSCPFSFEERVTRGIIRQLARVKSLPFWPVRGIYWFLVKRFLMANQPIWRQNIHRMYVD